MKELSKKIQKDFALTLHVTGIEIRYLRTRKRETGHSMSDVVREEYLSETAELFFDERKKQARNGHPAASDAPPLQ